MYADYDFYSDVYRGKLLTEADWPAISLRSAAFLDQLTFGRLRSGGVATDAVRMATCAVAEVLQTQRYMAGGSAGIKSESVGGQSVTYESAEECRSREALELLDAVDLWLPRSDPLRYTGGCAC